MAKKQQSGRPSGLVVPQQNQDSSATPLSSALSTTPKSKTSGAAKKKNKKKAAQARQLDSHSLDPLTDQADPNILADRSDMIGAYPTDDTASLTHRTTHSSLSPDDEDDDDEDDDDRMTSHTTMHPSLAAATRQTQEDLLATANDLYRQIETAAAAALASHLSPQSLASIGANTNLPSTGNHQGPAGGHSAQNGHSPHPDDDAYWSSLPSHLRSFIRSALPLAAGHSISTSPSQSSIQSHAAILPNLSSFAHATGVITSTTTSNNQPSAPILSSEQMAAAAEQLARVVQSHDWGRAVSSAAQQAGLSHNNGVNHIINGTTRSHSYSRDGNGAGATVSVTGGTVTGTIPLGSFTLPLPLHSHNDHSHQLNSSEPVYYTGETTIVASRIGDKHEAEEGVLEDDDYYSEDGRILCNDLPHGGAHRNNLADNLNDNGVSHNSSAATTTGSKKKKKKNKKKQAQTTSEDGVVNPSTAAVNNSRSPPPLPASTLSSIATAPSQLQLSTKKANLENARRAAPPGSTVPPTRLPPVPPGTTPFKKKPITPLSVKFRDNNPIANNNSASSSTITNTTSNNPSHPPTERERIRDFWLTLNQEERANLVKIEKDAVLKKMKEQQRHSCSCAVCGRKRQAIEQELEVLYDAYYDELEHYAEASKKYYGSGDPAHKGSKGLSGVYPKPPGPGPFPGSVDVMTTSTQPLNQTSAKKAVPKPTRDHKNVRPRPQQSQPASQIPNPNSRHYPPTQTATKRNLPPQTTQLKKNHAHSDHDHTHSPSCPHHPHHHGPNHYHPPSINNRGKAAANTHSTHPSGAQPKPQHTRTNDEIFPDEDADEDDDDDEYDEDEEEDYDDDEEEEGEFEDDEEIPALEEVPSEAPELPGNHKKPNMNGVDAPYNNKLSRAEKPSASNNPNSGDLFGFGNSLTVKGGILTVADDLLRNDGQKFLEMMESLADKRIQRERDAAENLLAGLEDDENDGDEYDEEEEDEDELDEDDGFDDEIVTEEYRMKEGRRMFQIFAARMFEQRVLTAYRERVAQEKQAQLLRELEDEDRLAQEREMKKVKDAQKKKEKKKAQKQQKDQDLAKKLKDKEREELAAKAAEEAKLEAEKRKQEEQRLKREAQRKQQEAERAKKEEEKRRRIDEEARKRRDKEEKLRLEKEAKAARDKEEREKKAREEAERKLKAEAERREKEVREAKIREEAQRKRQAEIERREAEEVAKREAAKVAAAKLAAQNKNIAAAASTAAAAVASAKSQQRSSLSTRQPSNSKPTPVPLKAPTNAAPFPMSAPSYPPHPPHRIIPPPPVLPRQMSIGIGLGRPASVAAAPAFSTAIPTMTGPSSYPHIPPRPPSAQYGTPSFPPSNTYSPSGLQNIPSDIHPSNPGMPSPLVGGPYMPMGGFQQPPLGPMLPQMNNRVFSGAALSSIPPQHYTNQIQTHPSSQQHRPSLANSIPPSTPTHPSGITSPSLSSATSPLSALHLGSEPVRKASVSAVGPIGPSPHHRRPSGIDDAFLQTGFFSNSIEPIGRPKLNGSAHTVDPLSSSSDPDSNSVSASTSPTRSPQNVLGSSALLAEDDPSAHFPRRHTMPTNIPPSGTGPSSFPPPPGPFESGIGVGSSIWGAALPTVGDSGWGCSSMNSSATPAIAPRTPLQPPQVNPIPGTGLPAGRENTSDWIRRRAISAYCNMRLNEKWIPVGDVSIEMQRIHQDTANVTLKDMVDACLIKRNIHNGGGDWQFSQEGAVLYTRWLPVSSQEASVVGNNV